MGSSARTAETGKQPPESALPRITMSGRTPSWSHASILGTSHIISKETIAHSLPRAPEPSLDLVRDEEDIVLRAQIADAYCRCVIDGAMIGTDRFTLEIAIIGDDDARLSLDGLHHEAGDVGVGEGLLERSHPASLLAAG